MPANHAAYIVAPKVKPLEVREAPYPSAGEGEIVIRNRAIGVAPVDWKIQDYDMFPGIPYPYILGTDVAGEVAEVGSGVTAFKKGDRVFSHAFGLANQDNAYAGYQEYTVAKTVVTAHLPDSISFEDGVVLPLAIDTGAVGLYQKDYLGLQLPSANPKPTGQTLLVWGGSSSVGSVTVQLARASGYEVISTASSRNHDYVKSLGASQVFDYSSPSIVDDILTALQGKTLAGAYDAISDDKSQYACADVLKKANTSKKFLAASLSPKEDLGVDAKWIFSVTVAQNEVGPAIWSEWVTTALKSGQLKPSPSALVVGTGLDKLQEAMDKQKAGLSAAKPVVKLD